MYVCKSILTQLLLARVEGRIVDLSLISYILKRRRGGCREEVVGSLFLCNLVSLCNLSCIFVGTYVVLELLWIHQDSLSLTMVKVRTGFLCDWLGYFLRW